MNVVLKYIAYAIVFKVFSVNEQTKKLYRVLGNTVGQRKRIKCHATDAMFGRGKYLLELCRKHNAIKDGDTTLEIGTGQTHLFTLIMHLFFDTRTTMMDIWDNRQLGSLKAIMASIDKKLTPDMFNYERAKQQSKIIQSVSSFDELYERFNLDYYLDREGSLKMLPDNHFNVVYSMHVLEHVYKDWTDQAIKDIQRILTPGGFSIHQIGIDDHLAHYDRPHASSKNYLRYSDSTWKIFFENYVQYFNRLQMSDWLSLFEKHKLDLIEKSMETCDIHNLSIHEKYKGYSKEDLSCTILTIVHRKRNPD